MNAKRNAILLLPAALLLGGCAWLNRGEHERTKKGAAAGAAAGAVIGAVVGEGEADEILAGAAIGAGVGAGVGAYMDRQERELTRIPNTSVERVGEDTLLLHMDSDVLFSEGSAVLSPSARDTLDEAANTLADYPQTAIVVQGHADADDEARAEELSERRAQAVANYLIGRGVDAGRITAVGYGAQHAGEYAANDRVDLLLKAKAS